jgi:hypothetical protein
MFNSLSIRKTTLYFSAILLVCLCAVTVQAKKAPKFKVIVFYSASYDQAHISYAHEFNAWIPAIAAKYNFSVDSTKDWKNLNTAYLAQYQVVLFLDNQPPASQRADFQKYMENGGGWIGFHVSAFTQRPEGWSWFYNDFLGSGSYKSNTWRPTSAILKIEDRKHPATKKMPETFKSSPNEWYAWKNDLKANPNIDIIASIDPSSFPLGTGPKLNEIWHEGYYPVVWTNKNYKMMYFNMGHNDIDYEHKYDNTNKTLSRTLDNDIQDRMLINAIMWMGTKKK